MILPKGRRLGRFCAWSQFANDENESPNGSRFSVFPQYEVQKGSPHPFEKFDRKTFRIILEESLMNRSPGQRKYFRLNPESKENPNAGVKEEKIFFEGFLGKCSTDCWIEILSINS